MKPPKIITFEEVQVIVDDLYQKTLDNFHAGNNNFFLGGIYSQKYNINHTLVIDMLSTDFNQQIMQFIHDQQFYEADTVIISTVLRMQKTTGKNQIIQKVASAGHIRHQPLKIYRQGAVHASNGQLYVTPSISGIVQKTDLDNYFHEG